jgi:protein JSN1
MIGDRPARRFDSALLKELRNRLDSGECSQDEIDGITHDLLDECAEVRNQVFETGFC